MWTATRMGLQAYLNFIRQESAAPRAFWMNYVFARRCTFFNPGFFCIIDDQQGQNLLLVLPDDGFIREAAASALIISWLLENRLEVSQ